MDTSTLAPFIPLDLRARREWIKFALHCKGTSIEALARQHGVSRFTAATALGRPFPKWECIIAEALSLRPEQLWPERYGHDGRPNRRRGRPAGYSPKQKNKPSSEPAQYHEAASR